MKRTHTCPRFKKLIGKGLSLAKEKIMPKIAVKKLDERAVLPKYGSEFAAGADLA